MSLHASAGAQPSVRFTSSGPSQSNLEGLVQPSRSAANLGEGCSGHIAEEPTALLVVGERMPWVRLFAESETDTTMVVKLADGTVLCDDDSFGHHPAVQSALPRGRHQLWIGSYEASESLEFRLRLTLSPDEWPDGFEETSLARCGPNDNGRRACLEADAPRSNFTCRGRDCVYDASSRDYFQLAATAGGGSSPVPVDELGLRDASSGAACGQSHVTGRPDARIWVRDQVDFLRFFVRTRGPNDATMLLLGPDGRWHCNDDAFGRMPGVDLESPSPGRYEVWIGSYDGSRSNPAALVVTRNENMEARPL